ncbi:MAG TPA: DHHA1 domain-containing protein, partial [Solirubrobacteraceae bacterium]
AEIVWDLMHGLDVAPTAAIAEALYVGLVTDTGRFMYENTGPRAHRMAAELIAAGANVAAVNTRLYEDMPQAKLALLGIALQRVQRFDSGELTLVALDAEDFARAGAEESFSEGIVDHLRSIAATKVAVLIRELLGAENAGKRKVSLRATGDDVDVSAIARTQGGGGHRRAAGFSSTLDAPELVEFLRHELAAQLYPAPDGPAVPTLA